MTRNWPPSLPALKEARYHLDHSGDWLVRLGDGTAESHPACASRAGPPPALVLRRFWQPTAAELAAAADGTGVDARTLQPAWDACVSAIVAIGHLCSSRAALAGRGKALWPRATGVHLEHLGFLLAE